MDLHVDDSFANRLSIQRAARLAKEAKDKRQRVRDAIDSGSAKDFWDLVDTSAGADACHPWRGAVNTTWTTYPVGKFLLDGCDTQLAHRIAVFLTYGREVPRNLDVAPICKDHLCCNMKHLRILPSSKDGGPRKERAVRVDQYFVDPIHRSGGWPGADPAPGG